MIKTEIEGMDVEIFIEPFPSETGMLDVQTILSTPEGRWALQSCASEEFIETDYFGRYMAEQVLGSYNNRER